MADYKASGAPPSYPEQYPPQQQQSYAGDHIQNSAPPQSQMVHHDSTFSQEKAHGNGSVPPQSHVAALPGSDTQQQMAAQGYQTAMPIGSLGAGAAPIDCPACNMRQMTRIEYKSGGTTWAWAAGVCICLGSAATAELASQPGTDLVIRKFTSIDKRDKSGAFGYVAWNTLRVLV
ncbi:MAG: hypothetical protein MMC23_009361 [Stictis urceolatum]|nr:hypothetical protein [Stictis urceolata]